MSPTLLLAWSVNALVGFGLIALGMMMVRRPERLWAGLRAPRDPGASTRMRRANLTFGPVLLFLGAVDILSGVIAMAVGMSAIGLAGAGLGILFASMMVMILAAMGSR